MLEKNKEIVRGFIEEVINAKRPDRVYEYYNPDSIWHTSPYVGVGLSTDDSTPDKIIVIEVAAGGPAEGKLKPKDQLIQVKDGENTWNTHSQLSSGVWGQGVPGTTIRVQVLREGQTLDFDITRGLIGGFDIPIAKFEDMFRQYLLKEWPDLKIKIDFLIAEGDLVAAYLTNSGTNAEYNRTAVWAECDLYRLRNGKIVESWAVEDSYARMKQEGYLIQPPVS